MREKDSPLLQLHHPLHGVVAKGKDVVEAAGLRWSLTIFAGRSRRVVGCDSVLCVVFAVSRRSRLGISDESADELHARDISLASRAGESLMMAEEIAG